ncbi:MAG: hypothetical protein M3547_03550 [Acidobacteriota bacterium]|nr:hypothetical protein [Acidobacteriota bacterium]
MSKAPFLRFSFLFAAATFLTVSTAKAIGPLQFYSVTPCRLADTREAVGLTGGPVLQSNVVRNFPVYGANARQCGISTSAKAVALNVTVVTPSNFGYLTAFPYNTVLPVVSTINFAPGEPALANGAIVPLTADASFQLAIYAFLSGGSGSVHVILDITGYFE